MTEPATAAGQAQKPVVMRFTVEMLREVPAEWDPDMIRFVFGESSHCLQGDLEAAVAEMAAGGDCCTRITAEYVREATAEDLARLR